jgi:hypothetical protein
MENHEIVRGARRHLDLSSVPQQVDSDFPQVSFVQNHVGVTVAPTKPMLGKLSSSLLMTIDTGRRPEDAAMIKRGEINRVRVHRKLRSHLTAIPGSV